MSRIYEDDEGIPWPMWERIVSLALGSVRGQQALAEMEEALVALPVPRLIDGQLAAERPGHSDVDVCAVGALVAYKKQVKCEGIDFAAAALMLDDADVFDTVDAGRNAGLGHAVAWHMVWLNDEKFCVATPEERYEKLLAWVRRAQGREVAA